VRRVGVLFRKLRVEPILREIRRVVRNVEAEAAQARGADENEQRLDRLRPEARSRRPWLIRSEPGSASETSMISADWELQ